MTDHDPKNQGNPAATAATMPVTDHSPPDLSLQGDTLTLHPPSVFASSPEERELLEPYSRFRQEPINALAELGQHISGTGWRSYDEIVGREIFYPGFSENMKSMVMRQRKLRAKIGELAAKRVEAEMLEGKLGPLGLEGEGLEWRAKREERRNELEGQLSSVAEEWTDGMICKMDSKYFIRGAYYFATQLLTRAYHQGIHINSEEVLRLRRVAEEAAEKGQSIIFLPCHRSHVDYVSLQVICYRLGLALPTVVAGDNLNFPVVGYFLQHAGAMWIRRSFGDDQLYQTLVQSYIDTLLQNGHNLECFIEGGRSRTGKLLQPKFGILSFVLDSVISGSVEDCIICPVSTQYDKVIEVDSYVSELLGQPKSKEGLVNFLSATNVLSLKLGRVDMRFGEPWSLRGFITEQRTRLTKQPKDVESTYDATLRRKLLTTLGYRVLKEINDVSVVMPTALVGTILLTLRGRGVGKSELVRRVNWLSNRVRAQNGRLAHFAKNNTAAVVERALEVLGPNLVGRVEGLPEETFFAEDRFQLSFYRNMTIHLFISQALVCAALYLKVKLGGGEDTQRISYVSLREYVLFLSQLFRAEFIFDTRPLDENLKDTLKTLEDDRVVRTAGENGEITTIELHPDERATGRENFDFYCFLIWPYIEAAWLGAISLFMLAPPPTATDSESWVDFKQAQDLAQLLGKTLYHQGDLSYYEAVNKEALRNAYARQEEEGIVLVSRFKEGKTQQPKVRLAAEWMPVRDEQGKLKAEGPLWEFCEKISQGRREGKNRRDGATVRTRVLGLAELVGRALWEGGAVEGGVDGVGDGKRVRRKGLAGKARL
jgi:1-acyl-sn-glycerol-3-phosphate acyltransferase